jgi:GAF domain-containing protein
MSTEELILRLRSEITRGASAGELAPTLDALSGALAAQREIDARVRRSHEAMLKLARSPAVGDGRLHEALREMTECASDVLGVERSSVWTYDAHQTAILCIDLYVRADHTHESGVVLPASTYPGYFRALAEERSIAARDAHTDPRTSEFSAGYLGPLGIGAMLDAPIRVGGRMVGVLCNEHVGSARAWTDDEERFAGSIADVVALALESQKRRESEEQLRAMVLALEDAS